MPSNGQARPKRARDNRESVCAMCVFVCVDYTLLIYIRSLSMRNSKLNCRMEIGSLLV